jgi:hypothetical protein
MFEFTPAADGHMQEWRVTGRDGRPEPVLELVAVRPQAARWHHHERVLERLEAKFGIALRKSGPAVRWPGMAETRLLAFAKDAFASSGVGILKFFPDSRGGVAGFTINRYNGRDVRFDRKKTRGVIRSRCVVLTPRHRVNYS